jgi:type II secretory pathway pseudopilin PulG
MKRGFSNATAARVGVGGGVDREGEQGFMLVGLIVAIFLILLVLGIAAPRVAKELQREREVEAMHRANQYVRAIQLYYRKNGTYPASMDALEKSNNIRFLRQKYLDPMTGKADWRLIHVGEAKTTVKGFFGQPLAGLAPGLGAAAGMASSGGIGAGAAGSGTGSNSAYGGSSSGSAFGSSSGGSSFGSSSGSSFGSSSGSAFGSSSSGSSAFGSSTPTGATGQSGAGAGGATTGSGSSGTSSGSSSGISSQSATSFTGGGAPFVGIGVPKEGAAIVVVNEQATYQTWEFLYDPRVDQMKSKASLFGGGPASASATGLGTANSLSSGVGGTGNTSGSAFGSSSSGFGSSSGSGFGSSSGSSFGSSSGSGFGSSSGSGAGNSGTGSSGSGSGSSAPPQ